MGVTNPTMSGMEDVKTNYVVLKSINDARYGEGRVLQSKTTKEEVLLKEINMTDEAQYIKWKKKLDQRIKEPHPNLINLLRTYSQQDSQFCGTFYKIYLVFDYLEPTLDKLIAQHKMQNVWVTEHDMWVILQGSVDGLSRLQQYNITHQAIVPSSISLNPDTRQVKISDPTLLNTMSSFATIIQDFQGDLKGIYVSPLHVKALEEGQYQPRHNPYKSDVFSLGMTLLHAGTLEPCDNCYRYEGHKFFPEEIQKKIDHLERYYSPELCRAIKDMLVVNEEARPDFLELKQELSLLQIPPQSYNSIQRQPQEAQEPFPQSQRVVNMEKPIKSTMTTKSSQLQDNQNPSRTSQVPQKGQDIPQTLIQDQADQIKLLKPNNQPSKESLIDENIGNEIGNHQNSPERQPEPNLATVNNNGNSQYQPVTARSPISQANQNNNPDRSSNYNLDRNSNYQDRSSIDPQVQARALIQKSEIHLNQQNEYKQSQVGSYVKQTQEFIQVDRYSNQEKPDPIMTNKYDYLYDNQLNTAQKISNYQEDLTKKFTTKTPNKFDNAVKNYEYRYEKESVIETYQNGSRYEGEKLNGMRHGRGKFFYQDGGVYDGEWTENKMHGRGTLYYASAKPAYEGNWIDDKFEGEGILYNECPQILVGDFDPQDMGEVDEYWTKYEGGFHDDNKEGMGILMLSNGDRFQGYFQSDMASGPGTYYTKKGQVAEGSWWQNKLQY